MTRVAAAGPRMERSTDDRVVAGVCAGIATSLGVDVAVVRIAFLVAAVVGGLGIALYIVAVAAMPPAAGVARSGGRQRLPAVLGTGVVVICLASLGAAAGLRIPLLAPVTLAAAGAALIWRRSGGEVRVGVDRASLVGGARAVGGVVLVGAGIALAIGQSGGVGPAVAAALSAGTVAAGIGLLVAPRLRRAREEAERERRERVSGEERERVASRLHDSVLQTLALIQRESDAERIRTLARRQDRELRAWLYGGDDLDASQTFGSALRAVVGDIEDAYGIDVSLVQSADVPMTERLSALVDATKEAITNAAKHAGVDRVNVLVRVGTSEVSVFVDDRGVGFDPLAIPSDRHGVRDSIQARLARVGGRAVIDTAPGAGTDIQLVVPRDSAP